VPKSQNRRRLPSDEPSKAAWKLRLLPGRPHPAHKEQLFADACGGRDAVGREGEMPRTDTLGIVAATARAEKFITEEIEREIEQMRVSRAATLEGQDSADSYLGVDGEKFKLLEHAPCPVEICRISAKKVELQPVFDFLRQQFSS